MNNGALVHESKLTCGRPAEKQLPTNTVRRRPTKFGHLIQDVARDRCLGHSPAWGASAKTTADNQFVPKEGVLHPGLPMVASLLLPPPAADLLHPLNRTIPRA
jgi:hypothetical protein